jgi:hypothetical protein
LTKETICEEYYIIFIKQVIANKGKELSKIQSYSQQGGRAEEQRRTIKNSKLFPVVLAEREREPENVD